MRIIIEPVRDAAGVSNVRALMAQYAFSLGLDLAFQGFDQELASLPGRYAPPSGELLLARCGDKAVGCVAVQAWDAARGSAEM